MMEKQFGSVNQRTSWRSSVSTIVRPVPWNLAEVTRETRGVQEVQIRNDVSHPEDSGRVSISGYTQVIICCQSAVGEWLEASVC